MNHDVFISYSSKRSEVANEICALLENSGLKCWIAPRDIVGNNYDDLIDEAVVSCKLFVFVFSQESSVSTWCKAELNLAFSENKAILPYRIDNTPLRGGFRLKLQMSHWLDASLDYRSEFPKLIQMATQIVGVSSSQPTPEPQQPQPEPKSQPQPEPQPQPQPEPKPKPQPTAKTYKVGDFYDDGTKRGVVFEVSPYGRHGKIVSVEQAEKQWAIEAVYSDKTGATSMSDGKTNMKAIQSIWRWRKRYPAFAWCADLGEGWYLPARDELWAIYKAKGIINATLSFNGCTELNTVYWSSSSSEYGTYESCAWGVYLDDGYTDRYNKDVNRYVRAVSAF